MLEDLRQVLKDTPILFTFRTSKEGGEKAIEAADYAKLNKEIAATGNVDLVDVEAFTEKAYYPHHAKLCHARNHVFLYLLTDLSYNRKL